MTQSVDNLWAATDIANKAGVSVQTITQWRKRGFPKPLGVVGGRFVYDKAQCLEWLKEKGYIS